MSSLAVQVASALSPLADMAGSHHDWGGGWWIAMAVGMVAFLLLVTGGGIWVVRELTSGRRSGQDPRTEPTPLEILDRRFAEGTISIEEYEERRRALLATTGHGGG